MTRRGAQSSQVDLFVTQISEQILRLRALTHGEEAAGNHDVVALKRAVMATRLLGGSARILQFESIHRFLERLLVWLQQIEERGASLTTTQALILDSVIELEEALMRHLELDDDDLSRYEGEFEQLLRLMERSTERDGADTHSETGSIAKPATGGGAELPRPASGTETLDVSRLLAALAALVSHLEETAEAETPRPIASPLWRQLDAMTQRLTAAISRHAEMREDRVEASDAGAGEPGDDPHDEDSQWPKDDPILDPLWETLRARSDTLGRPIRFATEGGAEIVGAGLRDVVRQILQHLMGDVLRAVEDWLREDMSAEPEIGLTIARESHRLHVELHDNAPRLGTDAVRAAGDHLTLYDGLRRARFLIQQLNGLIAVEPRESPGERFRLVLPAELRNQTYAIVHQDQVTVALPWVLTDGELPIEDLEIESDAAGDSFLLHGRSVPLVDLARYVPSLMPVSDSAESILVAGSVEKRIGIFCTGIGERVDSDQVGDPPQGWESVAYGGLNVRGETLPILDIHRLIRLRFDVPESDRGVSGSLRDVVLDSYVTVDSPEELLEAAGFEDEDSDLDEVEPARSEKGGADVGVDLDGAPEEPPPPGLRVLLVNQSEFRRRELGRRLTDLGHAVAAYPDLHSALRDTPIAEFDLVVTDLRLGHAGKDNLESLHEGEFVGPVILTSAAARDQAEMLARKVGADACWLDPYRPGDFESLQRALF